MSETIERATCPACRRPVFRYVTVRLRKSPGDTATTSTWWLHEHDKTFACDQQPTDG